MVLTQKWQNEPHIFMFYDKELWLLTDLLLLASAQVKRTQKCMGLGDGRNAVSYAFSRLQTASASQPSLPPILS